MPRPSKQSPIQSLLRTIGHYLQARPNFPSDMWGSVFETLTPKSAWSFLESLPEDLKAVIREEYNGLARDRFLPSHNAEHREVKQVIARWCEAGRTEDNSASLQIHCASEKWIGAARLAQDDLPGIRASCMMATYTPLLSEKLTWLNMR
jgi:hypothetical protein